MSEIPDTKAVDEKVNALLAEIRPKLMAEHPIVHGLVVAELTMMWLKRHPPKMAAKLFAMQVDATLTAIINNTEVWTKEKKDG